LFDLSSYVLTAFDASNLNGALATDKFPEASVSKDTHAKYLFAYLTDIGASTIVIEPDYVDGDFLDDFASYYASCFERFDYRCKRVHFFSESVDRSEFDAAILGVAPAADIKKLQTSYLGFIVVKPLPDAIIGRTQLRTYDADGGRRNYTAIATYKVHLFGLELEVRTLPFQEQDHALAACATVALWSCFHRTARMFGTHSPRPSRITSDAAAIQGDRRTFPSYGLSVEQMCSAIRRNALEPEVFGKAAIVEAPLISLMYGYLRFGLPILLLVNVDEKDGHALTLNGYSLRTEPQHSSEHPLSAAVPIPRFPRLPGLYIDEFYAHDDQFGPFSRLKVDTTNSTHKSAILTGCWLRSNGEARILRPTQIIVPVYPKIRLTYLQALKWLTRLAATAEGVAASPASAWDLYLIDTNAYKENLRGSKLVGRRKMNQLTSNQPRFFWRCIFANQGSERFEMLIDATGFDRSFPIFSVNYFDLEFAEKLVAILQKTRHEMLVSSGIPGKFLTELEAHR
jgi:hypothetical protein